MSINCYVANGKMFVSASDVNARLDKVELSKPRCRARFDVSSPCYRYFAVRCYERFLCY